MRVLLVGNYEPDRQESMTRFAEMLKAGLSAAGVEAYIIRPPVCFGARGFLGKWRAYVDKYVLFRRRLRRESTSFDLVHICDHSNAMYTNLVTKPAVVTCHDLLAVRGAMGEDTDCPASFSGKVLQRWIVRGLRRSSFVVCDSDATHTDFERIVASAGGRPRSRVTRLGLSHPFRRLPSDEAAARIAAANLQIPAAYMLHVGSSLRRKNREAILRALARLPAINVVFAGAPLNPAQRDLAIKLGVHDRVTEVIGPSNDLLEALYNRAHCLLFPSRFEGFGWPILEAQACGCPVICGNGTSLPEVAGDGAIIVDPDDDEKLAAAVNELDSPQRRAQLIERGQANLARFSTQKMIEEYIQAIRRRILRALFGYQLHSESYIGFSWVYPHELVLEKGARIGHLTVCKGIRRLHLMESASIGRGNWITGFPEGPSAHFAHQTDRVPQLVLGAHSAITHRHIIDCTNSVRIGHHSTVAGYHSQFLTHSIDLKENRQHSLPITIGDYCFVGTQCVVLGGSVLPSYSVLGAKALLQKPFEAQHTLYAGIPAEPIKSLPADMKYFQRESGFVV
jgi:glycosyltransferase involved in cell wall biosynthesis/acetyltransferase-like isoleucine patch superfamily enzyme